MYDWKEVKYEIMIITKYVLFLVRNKLQDLMIIIMALYSQYSLFMDKYFISEQKKHHIRQVTGI